MRAHIINKKTKQPEEYVITNMFSLSVAVAVIQWKKDIYLSVTHLEVTLLLIFFYSFSTDNPIYS